MEILGSPPYREARRLLRVNNSHDQQANRRRFFKSIDSLTRQTDGY